MGTNGTADTGQVSPMDGRMAELEALFLGGPLATKLQVANSFSIETLMDVLVVLFVLGSLRLFSFFGFFSSGSKCRAGVHAHLWVKVVALPRRSLSAHPWNLALLACKGHAF